MLASEATAPGRESWVRIGGGVNFGTNLGVHSGTRSGMDLRMKPQMKRPSSTRRCPRAVARLLRVAVVGCVAVGCVVVFGGCGYTGDAEIEPETSTAAPPPTPAPAPQEDGTRPPARSAYGKAMEAAHRLEDKVEDYNKKIEQAADDAFK